MIRSIARDVKSTRSRLVMLVNRLGIWKRRRLVMMEMGSDLTKVE